MQREKAERMRDEGLREKDDFDMVAAQREEEQLAEKRRKVMEKNKGRTTVTVQQAADIFRLAGISISLEALKRGIIDKAFPFGVAIKLSQWVFIIYRQPLYEYLHSVGAEIIEQEN